MSVATGERGSLVDVAGLAVGHFTDTRRPTGCTVVLCPQGVVCGVDVRGGAPGTRETDLLKSENTVQQVHAVLLTGGSAFGLDAAGGVMRWLEERGHGLPVGPARVPIVPAAVLFDLWVGDASIRPDAAAGYAACMAASFETPAQGTVGAGAGATASSAAPAQGNVGAGAGASVGKLFGIERAMKGGIGSASVKVGGITVAALVAVNAIGDIIAADGSVIAGARNADGSALMHSTRAMLAGAGPARLMAGMATTIGVVATDAALNKPQANKLASLAHHGLSRAIDPLTVNDGDALFALATGTSGLTPELTVLGAMAAEATARAVRHAVWAASAWVAHAHVPGMPSVPAARELLR
jgi:L-aminopeptidase/D-esterase-like protein